MASQRIRRLMITTLALTVALTFSLSFSLTSSRTSSLTSSLTSSTAAAAQEGADPSVVNTTTEAIPTTSLWEMLLAGGPLLVPIVVCSFVLLLAVFERAISLRRSRIAPRLFMERLLLQISEGAVDRREALERCQANSSLIADVFAAAIRKWGKPAVEVEQAVLDEGERAANQMRRFLRVINGVATVCPLMGLLGTVWGMMEAFNAIAGSSAMGRPELLAGGISSALLSTAAGLFVAIPALILYLFFVGRVDTLTMEIDRRGQELVDLVSAEAQAGRKSRPRAESKKKAA
ncbi:MotA/TolQ/ExbB proton channel family protein [Pirellulales bacterium]|nr:MotA/TolQ/ExbB proton channel family protein [Pirellulales bacterium]